MFDLQSRWKLEGDHLRYFGLRNAPDLFHNTVRVGAAQREVLRQLPCHLTNEQQRILGKLMGRQVLPLAEKRPVPRKLKEARFCTQCAANDFIIPGLEFDNQGCCPLCQTKERTTKFRSVVPVMNTFPRAKKSRFDVALFYTGGKDSTYLLYYLSKVQGLRVLALTWEIPFVSDSACRSIAAAREKLPDVEFISRKVADEDLRRIYRRLYQLSDNTCACPSLAYVLFYPELVANRVPYFVAGNEPAQMMGLYYNHMAPPIAYSFGGNAFLNALVNIGRVLTLHPPLKRGQFQTLATMRQLAYGDNPLKNLAGYRNQLVSNVVDAIHQVPEMVRPLRQAIRRSSWSGNIPGFVHVDLDEICGGVYEWRKIKDVIVGECGWVPPEETAKGLHTSCSIEKCKENSQFRRFYEMRSTMIPFSALEIALASRDGSITQQEAIAEMEESMGFSLEEICECDIMKGYIQ